MMHFLCKCFAFLALLNGALGASPFLDFSKIAPALEDEIIPSRYIVEFEDPVGLQKRSGSTPAEGFFETLKEESIQVTPKANFSSEIFQGASFTATKLDIEDIRKHHAVKQVWPARKVPRPVVDIAATGSRALAAGNGPQKWTNHLKTGVLELHSKGTRGKDILIAVVDSGIDYTHPALGGCLGPGCKVVGGYDFSGDEWTGNNDPVPDDDPMDSNGHGTHVAGILAASNSSLIVGVAPEAKLLAYKVFSRRNSVTSDDMLISAFLMAYEKGADIITASVAGISGWPNGPWAAVSDRLVQQGVFVSIAAGNQGLMGPGYPADGASGKLVAGVGSIENDLDVQNNLMATFEIQDGRKTQIKVTYYDNLAWGEETRPVWAPSQAIGSSNANGTGCFGLPADTPNLREYFVVFEYRSNSYCSFQAQMQMLAKFNATSAFWWQDFTLPAETIGEIGTFYGIKTTLIIQEEGQIIQEILKKLKLTVAFPDPEIGNDPNGVMNTQSGGKMSYFTSWGLTNTLDIKPDISAPGGNIFSTYPEGMGSYAILSGTSMATPYVAGVAALYASKHGGHGAFRKDPALPLRVRDRMITSGNGVPLAVPVGTDGTIGFTDYSVLAPIPQQGGGYVNASNVVLAPFAISPSKIVLNDTANFQSSFRITIASSASDITSFNISHSAAATFYLRDPGQDYFHAPLFPEWEKSPEKQAKLQFSISEVTVPGNGQEYFDVTFKAPEGFSEARFPVYSGKIVLTGSNGDKFEIPYAGVASNVKKYSPLPASFPQFKFSAKDSNGMPLVTPKQPLNVSYRLALPTSELRLDVSRNISISTNAPAPETTPARSFWWNLYCAIFKNASSCKTAQIETREPNGTNPPSSSTGLGKSQGKLGPYPFMRDERGFVGSIRGGKSAWPRKWLPRDSGIGLDMSDPPRDSWDGSMEDEIELEEGAKYKAVLRALAWNGDGNKEEDWWEYWSEEFVYRKTSAMK